MAKNGLSNVTVLCGKAEEVVSQKIKEGFDAVVLDPPRAGCHRDVLDFIGRIKPNKLIYVSCNPVTLARDGKILIELGYEPVSISPLDMFPQTSHIECVALMAKTA
jgi:23S rRNA (uracil1939-C5)-methyltransferase